MATAIEFTRNKAPHYAGDRIGTDPVTADRLVRAGYAKAYDLDAAARATALPAAIEFVDLVDKESSADKDADKKKVPPAK